MKDLCWPALFGILFFTGMMATGYYYNLTFVQFGLLDLGTRLVGLDESMVAANMAALALLTSLVAVSAGLWLVRSGWSAQLRPKLRLAFAAILLQTALTGLAPAVRSPLQFSAWIAAASLALGLAVPVTFGLTVDLVPMRYRGYVGALITAAAYFPAAVISPTWTVETFTALILPVMLAGMLVLGLLAFPPAGALRRLVERLAGQHERAEFGRGRFVRLDALGRPRLRRSLVVLFVLMFGIYFVDSLGFLRLAEEPFFFETAWQSPQLETRLLIGATHVIAALVAGVLYTALGERELFLWVFGIFGLVHLMYTFTVRAAPAGEPTLSEPFLYAIAVSLYTVINFAIWADISTPDTVARNAALGVALSAWTATFLSTALALWMRQRGVPLETHFRIVDSLAILFFLLVGILVFFAPVRGSRPETG